ncbi:MAG: glycosyltransferase family 1 protein [Prevotella sp.]|nr:glycosyltransferase family 1 protein [Prevotella sp.]
MKILFLVYHGFSDHSGISKKIHYQVKGLKENGYDVRLCYYGFAENGHRCRFVDDEIIKDYGKGKWAGIRQRLDYDCIYNYCIREGIEFVYARSFMNANPWLISFFKKTHKAGIHAVTEIPTYPYDKEFNHNMNWDMLMGLWIDKRFRRNLYRYMDAMVTFSDAKEIFGQKTINISNGVDFDSIPLHHCQQPIANGQLHLIGVAEVHPWHAFDRVIAGIGEYYSQQRKANSQQHKVYFHVVGGVHPNHMRVYFEPLIEKYQIRDKIIFHGTMFGKELDDVFNQCQFAIGSLGRHRSGITVIKTLKNREYATRGIPFIYSEQDSDFDHQQYVLKAPADETPIDIQKIIDFVNSRSWNPEEIRKTVEPLQWKYQMKKVVDAVFTPQ